MVTMIPPYITAVLFCTLTMAPYFAVLILNRKRRPRDDRILERAIRTRNEVRESLALMSMTSDPSRMSRGGWIEPLGDGLVRNNVTGHVTRVAPPISKELREEIDQTPAWWDKQFHNLLQSLGTEQVKVGEDYYETEMSFMHGGEATYHRTREAPHYIKECFCERCETYRGLETYD